MSENDNKKTGKKPKIGDTIPAKKAKVDKSESKSNKESESKKGNKKRRTPSGKRRSRPGRKHKPVSQIVEDTDIVLDESELKSRRGRSRKGKPVGRYLMVVSKKGDDTNIAILEGRTLIDFYVSRPNDNENQIHGNIYLGKVQNVLAGMEAAFVDIGTEKNAVIYSNDVQYDKEEFEGESGRPRIENVLKTRQNILCQVVKNPIAHKGARLTSEINLPGRFIVLVPESDTYGISKRLPDPERRRLRSLLDKIKPKNHGVIVRTAAENVTEAEIERDLNNLVSEWEQIKKLSKTAKAPSLLYYEPDMAVRVIREEFNKEFRGVIIDDQDLYTEVKDYVSAVIPALSERVEYYNTNSENLGLFERYHVQEQLIKGLDRKVWLPSGGSLIIESTEALTVIDVNTGKNVGSTNLEDTVFQNNLEAAEAIAYQLRLRDIGGIIVIDFVDMESKSNRNELVRVLKQSLSRDKTKTQVYSVSELGLVEMTRKRIGEGLLESIATSCDRCDGRGLKIPEDLYK